MSFTVHNCCQNPRSLSPLIPFLTSSAAHTGTETQQHRENGKGSHKIQAHWFGYFSIWQWKNIYLFLCNQVLSQSSLSEPHSSVYNHHRTSAPASQFADKLRLHTQGHVLLSEAQGLDFIAFDIQTDSVLCSELDPARNDTRITNRNH